MGKRMAVEFENWEEEMMKKIKEKAMKILTESKACVDLPDDLKEYVVKACESCLGQRSKADPGEVQKCLSQAVKLAETRLNDILKQQLEQCLDVVLKDLSKACSGYEDEAW
ncbi:hypothetical protein SE86_04725 [Acidilobus sp. 7A]|nr:hypothetical protein SE86_04725 [Acidilobus sp. 7A]